MGFLKRYLALLMPAGLLLVGGVVFVGGVFMSRSTRAAMSKSVSMGRQLDDLLQRAVPRDQWRRESEYQQELLKDAERVKQLAGQTCQRELLSYKIFPEAKDRSQQIFEEFGQNYCRAVDELIKGIRGGVAPSEAQINQMVGGGMSSELGRPMGRDSLRLSEFRPAGRGERSGTTAVTADIESQIREKLCQARAREIGIYADSSCFRGYDFWRHYKFAGAELAVQDCWLWQIGFWIQQDVAETIAAMNAGSESVLTSPVKKLVRISFRDAGAGETSSQLDTEETPRYVATFESGLVKSCTGRVCNEDIDVVHFGFAVAIKSEAVMDFLEQLCTAKRHRFAGYSGDEPEHQFVHNQITILDYEMKPVNVQEDYQQGYQYGDASVVKLNLVCEYVFDRGGCEPIKPESIKKMMIGQAGVEQGQVQEYQEEPVVQPPAGPAKKEASSKGKKAKKPSRDLGDFE